MSASPLIGPSEVGQPRTTIDDEAIKESLITALTSNPFCDNGKSWYNLGRSLSINETVRIGEDTFTKTQCYVRALSIDPTCAKGVAWYNLGTTLGGSRTVRVGAEEVDQQRCFLKAHTVTP